MRQPPRSTVLTTPRLILRPSDGRDAQRAYEIQSDPAVSRMLSLARFPPSLDEIQDWFAAHPREWAEGLAFRFAVLLEGQMIGLVDLDDVSVDGEEAEVGAWLDQDHWGEGYASEAALALRDFAFRTLDLRRLRAGHAEDNAGSERILADMGFRHVGDFTVPSLSRGEEVLQRRYILERD